MKWIRFFLLSLAVLALTCPPAEAARRHHRHVRHKHGQIMRIAPISIPEELRGSFPNRVFDHTLVTEFFGLTPFQTPQDVNEAFRKGILVPLPRNRFLVWHKELDPGRAYCLPFAARGAERVGRDVYGILGRPLPESSAVRPISVQSSPAFVRKNRNAIPTDSLAASTHPYAASIDFSYKDIPRKKLAALQQYFMEGNREGRFHATWEANNCIHVLFFPPETQGEIKIAAR